MDYALSEEQVLLESSARRFFEDQHPVARARRALAWSDPLQPQLWRQMAEMGWLGLLVPQPQGGQGLGLVEAFLIGEAAGRQLLNLPLTASAVLLPLLQHANPSCEALHGWVQGVLAGRVSLDVAMAESAIWDHQGQCSHRLLIRGMNSPADTMGWAMVEEAPPQTLAPGLDPTLRCAPVAGRSAETAWVEMVLPPASRQKLWAAWRLVRLGEMLGAAAASLDLSCDYARKREQFGRPIGSNQSIKHHLCNAWMALDNTRLSALHAAASLDGQSEDWRFACAVAELVGIEACLSVARYGIQVHGGLGFTWEHDAHLFLKRVQHLANRLGGSEPAFSQLVADPDRMSLQV